jgi:hypothetical protein
LREHNTFTLMSTCGYCKTKTEYKDLVQCIFLYFFVKKLRIMVNSLYLYYYCLKGGYYNVRDVHLETIMVVRLATEQ